jgi:2-phosphosulfolactate phosphatase
MTAALVAGVNAIRIFGDVESARTARQAFNGSGLMSGEVNTLPPPGFDLGNSPADFTAARCSGKTLFMSTTNGTRAILAARTARLLYVAALVNASVAANAIAASALDVTLICSGTSGQISIEDLLGCGAVLSALARFVPVIDESDNVVIARRLFEASRQDLPNVLRQGSGGHNIARVGLTPDIDFAARLDVYDVVGRVIGDIPTILPNGTIA